MLLFLLTYQHSQVAQRDIHTKQDNYGSWNKNQNITTQAYLVLSIDGFRHRVHRVVTAAFWRIFSHEGKIGPGWWGWGLHAHPLSLLLPSPVKLQCTLQLSGQTQNPVSSLVKYVLCGFRYTTLWTVRHQCRLQRGGNSVADPGCFSDFFPIPDTGSN